MLQYKKWLNWGLSPQSKKNKKKGYQKKPKKLGLLIKLFYICLTIRRKRKGRLFFNCIRIETSKFTPMKILMSKYLDGYSIAKNCSDIKDCEDGIAEIQKYLNACLDAGVKPAKTAYLRLYKLDQKKKGFEANTQANTVDIVCLRTDFDGSETTYTTVMNQKQIQNLVHFDKSSADPGSEIIHTYVRDNPDWFEYAPKPEAYSTCKTFLPCSGVMRLKPLQLSASGHPPEADKKTVIVTITKPLNET